MQTTIYTMTVADLMSQDFDVWLKKKNSIAYELSLEGCDDESLAIDEEVHAFAIDSMADFCNRFLTCYNKLNKD